MLTGNALIMKPGIYSVNTLQFPADQHIVGENNFFLEPSQKGVAQEIGHFCVLCIETATFLVADINSVSLQHTGMKLDLSWRILSCFEWELCVYTRGIWVPAVGDAQV